MLIKDIIGLKNIKSHLTESVKNGRIPHAQLFVGSPGSGTLAMAIAYAQYILCNNKDGENIGSNEACNLKCNNLSHPDLHFAFPVATTNKVKTKPISNYFLTEWREFINQNPYGNLYQWMQFLDVEKKQGLIGKDEALEVSKKLSLKSFEGGYKIMIIWMAEKMNIAAANKLLKLIEEPPEKTVLILIAEDEEQIIKTILSRCQVLHFPKVSEENIIKTLVEKEQTDKNLAVKIAHQANGNWNKALQLSKQDDEKPIFETWFITWIRAAFRAKGNASVIEDLINWSNEISKTSRETQKQFLHYCLHFFRQAMLLNYKADKLVYLDTKSPKFDLKNFAPFIHGGNIYAINQTLNEAIYHIERNGSAKIILLDISIKLTRLLHTKEE
ncbi:MAG TPA: DNA polymerase III subunit delta' [Flavobacteriaceae bacterium]|nr:DNA polymerase III subunit delta' [Flavobacteriaceae bacterium]